MTLATKLLTLNLEDTVFKYLCKTFANRIDCNEWQQDHPKYDLKLVTCHDPYIVLLEMPVQQDSVPIDSTITSDELELDGIEGVTPKRDTVDYIDEVNFDDTRTSNYSRHDYNYLVVDDSPVLGDIERHCMESSYEI